ncbi:hypothetical protein IMZ48_13000 [Candidatus Bathyarchaeota archaeon]|nr:hypothetical protein [Candidatus Bathyarchaeota archaeon]
MMLCSDGIATLNVCTDGQVNRVGCERPSPPPTYNDAQPAWVTRSGPGVE